MISKMKALIILITFALLIAACSPAVTPQTTSVPATDDVVVEPGESVERTIKHTYGETIITGTPVRVIALEWTYVEDLLALGIQPVGVADIEGYNEWVKTPVALSPDVVDVGIRGEPNLEVIASLHPDLIIDIYYNAATSYDKLSAIAPTLIFEPYPTDESITQYEEMRTTFMTIADVVGRVEEGEKALAHMDEKFAEARATLESAGLVGEKFVLSQMFSWENAVYVRLFTDNGMATEIVEQLGLENGWGDGFQQYGFTEVGVETLPELGDVHFFYVVNETEPVLEQDTVTSVWDSLEFVKADHAYPLGGDTWLFGGPLSAELLVDIVVNALTGQQ